MSLAVVAGCGRSADTSGTSGGEPAAQAIDDSPATGEIQVWAFGSEGEALETIAADFEVENPDADVVITPVPNDELPRKVDAALATGNVPDIVQPSTALPTYVATGGLAEVPDGVMDPAGFFPAAVDAGAVDGVQYAVPWYVTVQALYFRTDLVEAAGVEPPEAWEDMAAFSQAVGSEGAEFGYAAPFDPSGSWNLILPLIYQHGGAVVDDGEFRLDTAEVVEALTTYQDLFTSGAASTEWAPTQLGETESAVADGRIGSYTSGSFAYGFLKQTAEAAGFDPALIGIAPLPGGPAGNSSYLGGSGLSVFEEAPNADGAWKFIRYLTQPEVQAAFFEAAGVLPAATAAWDESPLTADPQLDVFRSSLEIALAPPTITTWLEVRTMMSEIGEQLARGAISPEDAAAQLQQQAESIGTGQTS
ncbi:sugar ABC transporter substrate-binding protein [Jiangella anatolica]|nr:extracellular solute-binding protein [Jiangella anatolica]